MYVHKLSKHSPLSYRYEKLHVKFQCLIAVHAGAIVRRVDLQVLTVSTVGPVPRD